MILVTGGYGCIGAELVKWLLRNTDEEVLLGSRTVNEERTLRTFHDVETAKLVCIEMDVSDQSQIDHAFKQHSISRVAHLGALQTPDCNAHRDLGLQINLGGTQKLVEVAKAQSQRLERFVFASSIGVYGPRASYPTPRVPLSAEPNPVNVYGVWKHASEQVLKLFAAETGVPTVSLRPGVLFGPGRDQGLTSTPTTAMKCVALKRPYKIPFRSKQDYLYAPDVGAAFGVALTEPFTGYDIFTLPAKTVAMEELVATMREAAEEAGLAETFDISFGDEEVPFICDLEFDAMLKAFPATPQTDFKQALVESLNVFKDQIARGWLSEEDLPPDAAAG